MKNDKIFVTKPFLPPLSEFNTYLEQIWENRILTNQGPFHEEFEKKLCEYLGVKHISLFSNGTLALLTALHALQVSVEVITTPYSFVATTHALWWNNIKPVFVDIDPRDFNIDADKIEAAITPNTKAILAVHVYGNPCNVEKIEDIAKRRGLRVIYDACHTFNVRSHGKPILNYGDLSVMSFHATKVFSTFEGGAIISHDLEMKKRIDNLKNFGFQNETTVVAPGINAKMNEFQAALGLVQLKYIDEIIKARQTVVNRYRNHLQDIKGIKYLNDIQGIDHCYSYFPILVDSKNYKSNRDELYEKLKTENIFARRYFYPLISHFPPYSGLDSASAENLNNSELISKQVICLPLYPELSQEDQMRIIEIVRNPI